MFSTFVQELKGYLGKGYLLAVFMPTLIAISLAAAVSLELTVGIDEALRRWSALQLEVQLILSLGGLAAVALAAYLIHNSQVSITRLAEGYWQNTPLSPLYGYFRRRYQKEYAYLDQQREALEQLVSPGTNTSDPAVLARVTQLMSYWSRMLPPPGHADRIQPTRFGNVLRAGELYAEDHYGIDAVVIWLRLRPLLPASFVESLQDRKIAVDFMLLMTLYGSAFTLVACPAVALFSTRWELFLLCALGLPLAAVCYHNAVQGALAYSESIRSAFDLYRFELLKTLGLRVPVEPQQERALWATLSLFYGNNIPPTEPRIYQIAIKDDELYRYLLPPTKQQSHAAPRASTGGKGSLP